MVIVADLNEMQAFSRVKPVESIEHTILKPEKEPIVIKLALVPEAGERKACFFTSPKTEAFSFPKQIHLNREPVEFSIIVHTSSLPDLWSGDLNIVCDGFAKKIPIFFKKLNMTH